MKHQIKVNAASNTMAPCWALLEELGYQVSTKLETGEEEWIAENEEYLLSAIDPCMLLGLAKLVEARGPNWPATDEQIDAFIQRFYKSK